MQLILTAQALSWYRECESRTAVTRTSRCQRTISVLSFPCFQKTVSIKHAAPLVEHDWLTDGSVPGLPQLPWSPHLGVEQVAGLEVDGLPVDVDEVAAIAGLHVDSAVLQLLRGDSSKATPDFPNQHLLPRKCR